MVAYMSHDRMFVGYRRRDWQPIFYKPVGDEDGDGGAQIGLYRVKGEGDDYQGPMEGEIRWLPPFDVANCESNKKGEREMMQQQTLSEAYSYLTAKDRIKMEELERKYDRPHFVRWQHGFFLQAKKWKQARIRDAEKRAARKAEREKARARGEQVDSSSSSDSGYSGDDDDPPDFGPTISSHSRRSIDSPPPNPRKRRRFGTKRSGDRGGARDQSTPLPDYPPLMSGVRQTSLAYSATDPTENLRKPAAPMRPPTTSLASFSPTRRQPTTTGAPPTVTPFGSPHPVARQSSIPAVPMGPPVSPPPSTTRAREPLSSASWGFGGLNQPGYDPGAGHPKTNSPRHPGVKKEQDATSRLSHLNKQDEDNLADDEGEGDDDDPDLAAARQASIFDQFGIVTGLNGGLDDDEALAMAMRQSMEPRQQNAMHGDGNDGDGDNDQMEEFE